MPFAMYGITHTLTSLHAARIALAQYELLYIATMIIAAWSTARNLRRGWLHLEPAERDKVSRAFVRRLIVGAMMSGSFAPSRFAKLVMAIGEKSARSWVVALVRQTLPRLDGFHRSLHPTRATKRCIGCGSPRRVLLDLRLLSLVV